MRVLVTGGCGFIGSALVRLLVKGHGYAVCNLDKLTYSGDQESVEQVAQDPNYEFVHGDICDAQRVSQLLQRFKPDVIVHTAAETHVDRSIGGPGVFIETNILGTFNLLEQGVAYWTSLPEDRRNRFRFLHVSTDEVFGELGDEGKFTETNAYQPNSPYSASKAA
ncbi:MAG: GDP-mannose 4,6-dehydratase, partial [Pseudomonadota bacterium]